MSRKGYAGRDRSKVAGPASTYATVAAAARLAGVPERKAAEWIEQGRVRTSKSAGEVLACLDDLDRIAAVEGWSA